MSGNVCVTRFVRLVFAFTVFSFTLSNQNARASDFFIDPSSGSPNGDGSETNPWQTLESSINAGHFDDTISEGDSVWLKSGYHGEFIVSGGNFSTAVTVAAASGETPEVSQVVFRNASGWIVKGLSISPTYASTSSDDYMVSVEQSSSNIVFEDCNIFSVEDASNWGADEWINTASSGIFVRGDHVTLRNNAIFNVRFGISVVGSDALVELNTIDGFSADGIRGLGDNCVYQYNTVKNVYVDAESGDDNHDDGFQSWSTGPDGPGSGVVTGVVLRGNVILNRTDPNQPFRKQMQGIGCFDGFFENWVVENNVVATDHWHGISFYGMRNSRIVNNTVIDINDDRPGPPWIMVNDHKDGRPSENVIVRNNLATDFDLKGNDVVEDHNTTLENLSSYFVDPSTFDLHLLPSSPAIDNGSAEQAPQLDADRIPRPQGGGVDLGAYEWHDPSVSEENEEVGTGGNSGTGNDSDSGSEGEESRSNTGGTMVRSDAGSEEISSPSEDQVSESGGVQSSDSGGTYENDASTLNNSETDAMSNSVSSSSGGCSCDFVGSNRKGFVWILPVVFLFLLLFRRYVSEVS